MKTVSAAEANRQFSRLLREVRDGETVTITSHGKPVARLIAAEEDQAGEKRRAWLEFVEELKQRPTLNLGKFNRDWAYED